VVHVTEVRIHPVLPDASADGKLLAFASITLDGCFVVHDIRIIRHDGEYLVSMPSRRVSDHCPGCDSRNHLMAAYCNACGRRLGDNRAARDDSGRLRLFSDVAHPVTRGCRQSIEKAVIEAYQELQWRGEAS
jgi:stage V sporulation protein G